MAMRQKLLISKNTDTKKDNEGELHCPFSIGEEVERMLWKGESLSPEKGLSGGGE